METLDKFSQPYRCHIISSLVYFRLFLWSREGVVDFSTCIISKTQDVGDMNQQKNADS